MSAQVDSSGVLCCGNCRAHLVVACSAGCDHPDTEVPPNPIALLPRPNRDGRHDRVRKPRVTTCTWFNCTKPVAQYNGIGQPPRRCEDHKTKRYGRTGRNFGNKAAA